MAWAKEKQIDNQNDHDEMGQTVSVCDTSLESCQIRIENRKTKDREQEDKGQRKMGSGRPCMKKKNKSVRDQM